MRVRTLMLWVATAALGFGAAPASAQITTIDPNTAIDSDLKTPPPPPEQGDPQPVEIPPAAGTGSTASARTQATNTYQRDDLIGAAEGVFGKGASGLAGIIENILKDQGEPNAYIAGREAGGAIGVGLRYGSGELFHKVEGQR